MTQLSNITFLRSPSDVSMIVDNACCQQDARFFKIIHTTYDYHSTGCIVQTDAYCHKILVISDFAYCLTECTQ